jgi:hypothetical protein
MKEIKAFEAGDGTHFFTEAECLVHENKSEFFKWYCKHQLINDENTVDLLNWLINNAEDIRGFLPPVEAKPELDIEVLRTHMEPIRMGGFSVYVHIQDVKKWLAGELK